MKDDTISRRAAIDALDKEYRCTDQSDDWDGLKTAMLIIENLPSAQPERKKGRWIDNCSCSNCNWINEDDEGYALYTTYDFCPNCGADMRRNE